MHHGLEPGSITSLAGAADELRAAVRGRRFAKNVAAFSEALETIRDERAATLTAEDLARLRAAVEQAIAAIEDRIGANLDRPAVQQGLAASIYGLRRQFEEIASVEAHYRRADDFRRAWPKRG